jgi:putative transposase
LGVLSTSVAGGRIANMGRGKQRSPEQIVRLVHDAETRLANGEVVADVCRAIGVSESSFYRWRERYAGMSVPDAKLLRELERENATLKRLLAEAELEKAALRVIAQGKW